MQLTAVVEEVSAYWLSPGEPLSPPCCSITPKMVLSGPSQALRPAAASSMLFCTVFLFYINLTK